MEQFTEEHSSQLLTKEWLVKTDNQTSTAYLFKYYLSPVDLSCFVLLTDTKSAWAEVLTSGQFARRWRDSNRASAPPYHTEREEEDEWRETTLEQLSSAHTLGGITDFSFEVTSSVYSDLAFILEGNGFKWRWETCFLGHKTSAEVISKHLICPLISTAHLAFSSTDAFGELPDEEVEKALDKVGRAARRAVDTHIKNALSKPRLATSLRRMTATFNFVPELPPVISMVERPDIQSQSRVATSVAHHEPRTTMRPVSPQPRKAKVSPFEHQAPALNSSLRPPPDADSATESEEDDLMSPKRDTIIGSSLPTTTPGDMNVSEETRVSPRPIARQVELDSASSPPRPTKRLKKQPISSSSDDDSEEERKKHIAEITGGAVPQGARRGTKQPIKRSGKRF